ncbi:MAG: hypothetical protein QM820_43615 [Minicystis sp.]
MMSRSALFLLALGAAGCAAGTEEPGAVGYVLLDPEARAAGQLSHDNWAGAPMLPVALDVTEPVAFASPVGRTVFDLRPGALAYVHGRGGSIEWLRVGEDVGEDRLRVYGTKEAAEQLAQRLAGRVEGGGDGRWTITAPEVFERASFLKVPEGIKEIAPEPMLGARALGTTGVEKLSVLAPSAPLPDGESEGVRQAMVVGVYQTGLTMMVLDAEGGYALMDACSGDVSGHGRYRTDGDRVVLDGESGAEVFAWEGGSLRHENGVRYTPLVAPEPAPAREPAAAGGDL